jgi:hypothetical protein
MVKRFMELVLTADTVFEEDIVVENSIRCTENNRFSLKVAGDIDARDINARDINAWDINAWNINAWNINAWDINAWNINAGDINARNIDAWNINAWDINARDIICETRKKKSKTSKTIARIFVQGRPKLERKEQMPEKSEGAK